MSVWYLRQSELMPIIWNLFPYIITAVSPLIMKKPVFISNLFLGAVLVMLFIDGWLYIETILKTNSPVLLAMSLISTLKLFIAFPVGAFLGYMFLGKGTSIN